MLSNLRNAFLTTLRLDSTTSTRNTPIPTEKPAAPEPSLAEARQALTETPAKGVIVHLSAPSLMKSAQQDDKSDIDESDLPDPVKNLLKHIRELKKQLAEKQRELQEIQADPQLSDEERAEKVQALQGEISALNSALITANHSLRELIKTTEMTDEQVSKTLMLSMK